MPGCPYSEVLSAFDGDYKENQKSYREEDLQDYIRYTFWMDNSEFQFHVIDGIVVTMGVEPLLT